MLTLTIVALMACGVLLAQAGRSIYRARAVRRRLRQLHEDAYTARVLRFGGRQEWR